MNIFVKQANYKSLYLQVAVSTFRGGAQKVVELDCTVRVLAGSSRTISSGRVWFQGLGLKLFGFEDCAAQRLVQAGQRDQE